MPAPFAFVEEAPIVGSPACKAGLLAGDAILRFGAATCLEDLAGEIVDGKAVRVSVVEAASGKTVSRIVVPCVYDANQPHSLLGCQVADQCPERFMPHPSTHPEGLVLTTARYSTLWKVEGIGRGVRLTPLGPCGGRPCCFP